MTNIQSFYDDFADTDIAGVTSFPSIPHQLSTARLPCKYVRYAGTRSAIASLSDTHGLPVHTYEIVFIIEPFGQSTNVLNQIAMMTIADEIHTYIESISCVLTYNTEAEINVIANTQYWSMVVTVEVLDNGD